jgi:hypothetical protein
VYWWLQCAGAYGTVMANSVLAACCGTMSCYNDVYMQIKDEIDELHREAREGWCDFDKV